MNTGVALRLRVFLFIDRWAWAIERNGVRVMACEKHYGTKEEAESAGRAEWREFIESPLGFIEGNK